MPIPGLDPASLPVPVVVPAAGSPGIGQPIADLDPLISADPDFQSALQPLGKHSRY